MHFRHFTFAAATAMTLLGTPSFADDRPIGGTYAVEGRNSNGSAYSGNLVLEEKGGRVFGEWLIAGQSYRGSGRRDGRILTLHWEEGAEPVVYVLMPDGELHGTWGDGYALERAERSR